VLIFLILITLLRVASGFFMPFSLQIDEAQYAGWGHDLAWGYFSKPPFIAWALRAAHETCSAFGLQGIEGCTRMFQAPALGLASLMIMASAWQLFKDKQIALLSGALFLLLPLVSFYSLVATTDAWLLMWWSAALLCFILMQQNPNLWWPFLCCGLAIGFGVLAKYAMLVFLLSAIIWVVYRQGNKPDAHSLKRAMIAFLIAIIVFIPNLLWNAQVGFPTISHHVEITQVPGFNEHHWQLSQAILGLFSFLASQLFVFGPWALLTLLLLTISKKARASMAQSDQTAILMLLVFIWPMLGLMLIEAFLSRAFVNWAVAAYVAGAVLVAAFWVRQVKTKGLYSRIFGQFAIKGSLVFGGIVLIFMMVAPHYFYARYESTGKLPVVFQKMQGWQALALWVKARLIAQPMRVIADDRYLLAELSVYAYPEAYPALAWNPRHLKNHHYHWFYDLADAKQTTSTMLLMLTSEIHQQEQAEVLAAFESVKPIVDPALDAIFLGKTRHRPQAFEVSSFKGYSQ
jgi:4-amino-4-deoxy-L-arabinose transferase-like glycosyltransferase